MVHFICFIIVEFEGILQKYLFNPKSQDNKTVHKIYKCAKYTLYGH